MHKAALCKAAFVLRSKYMITKRTKLMLGVLVLVAIGAYAYLYWWSKTPDHGFLDDIPVVRDASNSASGVVSRTRTDAQQPTTPNGETPEAPAAYTYRTYQNTEFGFSFAYPDAWTVSSTEVSPETEICIKVAEATGGCLATITFEKESVNMRADIALDAFRAEFRAGRIAESSRSIAGAEATRLTISGYPQGEEGATRAAVFTHDSMVYTIKTAPGYEAVFDRIVSSFAFQD